VTTNPYQPPRSSIENTDGTTGQIQALPAKAGFQWFVSAFRLFRRRPLPLIFFAVPVGLLFSLIVGLAPIFGFIHDFYDYRPAGWLHDSGLPEAVSSVEYIMREVPYGYLIRFIIYFFLSTVIIICSLFLPVMMVCVYSVCRMIDSGELVTLKNLWSSIKKSLVFLLIYGFFIMFFVSFVHIVARRTVYLIVRADSIPADAILVLFLSILFFITAFCSSLFLRVWKNLSVFRLIYYSAVAYMKNWKSFLVNGSLWIALILVLSVIVGIVLVLILNDKQLFVVTLIQDKLKIELTALISASLFITLGMISPVMFANAYYSYKTIFRGQNESLGR